MSSRTESTSSPSDQKNDRPLKSYQPPLPFQSQARDDKRNEDYQKFLEHFKAI